MAAVSQFAKRRFVPSLISSPNRKTAARSKLAANRIPPNCKKIAKIALSFDMIEDDSIAVFFNIF
jgi:hypothetical protein